MYGIILSGHGNFSSGIKSMVELVLGPQEKMDYINYEGDCSSIQLKKNFKKAIIDMKETKGTIFLTDLKGGTPFNAAVELSMEIPNVYVFGGVNIPMIVSALEIREDKNISENILDILNNARDEMILFHMKKNESKEEIEEDGI